MHKLERLCETMLLYNYIMSACHREIYTRDKGEIRLPQNETSLCAFHY